MKTIVITAIVAAVVTATVQAADVPMQCNLTCKTGYDAPESKQLGGEPAPSNAPKTVDELLAVVPPQGAVTGIPLGAGADSDITSTSGFDFTTECVQYTGKIWAWREGKCKSMSADWKSPGVGQYIKH